MTKEPRHIERWQAEMPVDREQIGTLVDECKEFHWARSAGGRLLSVNYAIMQSITFDRAIARECRGLAFDAVTGAIAARPFHKFFNWGERPEEDRALDWTAPHRVCEKLDGTLMFPAVLADGEIVWCTREGRTGMAAALQDMLPEPVWRRAASLTMIDGVPCTPCFEHTSPANRIVLQHDRPRLRLLAVRERDSGRYLRGEEIREACAAAGIGADRETALGVAGGVTGPPETVDPEAPARFVEDIWARKGEEGVVIAFETGHRVKVKTAEYADLHHVRSHAESERIVLSLVLKGSEDILYQVLAEEEGIALRGYADSVRTRLRAAASEIAGTIESLSGEACTRKDFASRWMQAEADPIRRAVGFQARDALERRRGILDATEEALGRMVSRKCARQKTVAEEVRPAFGLPQWKSPRFGLESG